jgi:hypothetical protein
MPDASFTHPGLARIYDAVREAPDRPGRENVFLARLAR